MYRKEIEAYIDAHKEEMLEDICKLCRINSEKMPAEEGKPFGKGAYDALQAALAMAEGYGFAATNYDNYVGTADLNDGEACLDILAHLDVVPAGEGWTVTEPFAPVVKEGNLYGRGTADDKGPAVAALYAMRAVKELGIPLKKNTRLILGTDEECGGEDIEHYYAKEQEAPMTFSPDSAFPVTNVEKGRFPGHFTASFEASEALPRIAEIKAGVKVNVVPGKAQAVVEGFDLEELTELAKAASEKLNVTFTCTAEEGKIAILAEGWGAHAAHPQDGRNALTALVAFLASLPLADCPQAQAVKTLNRLFPHGETNGASLGIAREDEVSGALTLAFSMLEVSADKLEGVFDSRCPICCNEENTLEAARETLAKEGMTLLNDSMIKPHYVDADSEFIRTLLAVYEEHTGMEGYCEAIGGGTYVHDLKNGVAYGAAMPGTDNKMHGADEFAVVDELVLSAKIFADVIVRLCS